MAGGIKIVVDGGTSGVVLGVEGSRTNDAGGVRSSTFVKCRRWKLWDCRNSPVDPLYGGIEVNRALPAPVPTMM